MFKNGDTSNASMNGSNKERKTFYAFGDYIVRKVIVNFRKDSYTVGFRLFDKDDSSLLSIGSTDHESKEFLLAENERIVGFESRLHSANSAYHNSLVFVIARLNE